MNGTLAVGVDLGGTQVRAALVDDAGTVIRRAATMTDTQGGPEAVIGQIAGLVDAVLADEERASVVGVGVAAPGPLDDERGLALAIPTLRGFVDLPLVAMLAERLRLTVKLGNDGLAAVLGEWRFGAGRGFSNLVYITVSTGLGGGVVADGRLLRGRRGMACHVGHMTVVADGALCACGNRGCWEAHASGTAFAQEARRRAAGAASSALSAHGERIDAGLVFEAARQGDALASAIVAEEADMLGLGIVNLLHLYSPERVVIGGGVSNGFDLLHPGIVARVVRTAMPPFRDVPIVRAELAGNSGLVGAAALVLPGSAAAC
jgi:glucokinase